MASEETGPENSAGRTHARSTIQRFDNLITASARRASLYINGTPNLADDIAQDVRLHMLRTLENGPLEEPVIRRVIINSIRDRIRFERNRIQLTSMKMVELDDRIPAFTTTNSPTRPEIMAVAKWVAGLPGRLRTLFHLLYRFGYTQREAGPMLGLSQPRVTQLHQELIQRGRIELSALAT